jgi:hypothetical protein
MLHGRERVQTGAETAFDPPFAWRYRRTVRALLLCFFLAVSAQAEWKRLVINPKDDFLDSPREHPLEYFTQYPLLHYAGDFCSPCSKEGRLAAAQDAKVRAEVTRLGKVRDKEVLDVTFFGDGQKTPSWKSILVEKTPGRYYEIYQVEPNLGAVLPSYLIALGPKDALIAAKDDCQRYGCTEEFFSIGRMGRSGSISTWFSPRPLKPARVTGASGVASAICAAPCREASFVSEPRTLTGVSPRRQAS